MATPDPEPPPLKLPVEAAALPSLDALVVEAICLEHKRSILQFAERMLGFKWSPEQIVHVAAVWPWESLARAIAWERERSGQPLVAVAVLDELKAKQPVREPESLGQAAEAAG